jgi:ATP-dependent helicase/nuclease subunit B
MSAVPHLFTIPASVPFLPTLISALVEGRLVPDFPKAGDPLALASATLYLPTRRACRLARDVFLDVLKGEAAILPRIVALGDIDEDEIAFAEAATGKLAEESLALRRGLGDLERKLLLAKLVVKWAERIHPVQGTPLIANNPSAAIALATDLARLLDDMTTRQVTWERLDDLAPEEMDEYWQLTLRFLQIAREEWPKILAERDAMEPAARRDALIAAEAARLQQPNAGPVIAAGSTGSMPSTAMLLATIANLPQGALVLPGLDTDLDDASWDVIAGKQDAAGQEIVAPSLGHPQFALALLLRRLGITRAAVMTLAQPAAHGREAFVSEALRPAAATELWPPRLADKSLARHIDNAAAGVAVIEAATAEDEALGVAVALREAVEDPAVTAALITPDRALARRVLAALERWKVPVDDSGGDPLTDVPAGIFARLAVEVALGGVEPVPLLALLKHPLFRVGGQEFGQAQAIAILERAILRGPRPKPGCSGLAHALRTFRSERKNLHRSDPRSAITDQELDAADALVAKLALALAPLERLSKDAASLADLAARHRDVIAASSVDAAGKIAAFSGADGTALAVAFAEIAEIAASEAGATFMIAPADYPEVFCSTIGERNVRRPATPASRVRILGPLEGRLQQADRIVLGGMVEGVWPPEPRADPWLSRPMRAKLALDLPERRIGLSAHDFAQALGAREVVLTRAAKREGSPTVPSRFLQRLAAVAGEARWKEAIARGENYLDWARALDHPAEIKLITRPAPKPPRAARPSYLTVTEIEHWLRDPYTIYAKHILALQPLDAVDTPPGARDRGNVIHEALGEFTERFKDKLPDDPYPTLIAIGQKHFAPLEDYAEARAFWWPRFQRIARWFAGWAAERNKSIDGLFVEIRGKIEIPLGERTLVLAARADRIERRADGHYAIIDYKTGTSPTEKQVRTGLSPQLTLEAAMLRAGGFERLAPGSIAELVYVELRGGEPPGKPCPIEFRDGDADSHADRALKRLTEIATRFEDEATPYLSLVHPMWKARYGDYDHLARVKEWSATAGTVDEGASE